MNIIILDNFYPDPDKVRDLALSQEYILYEPSWYSSALYRQYGKVVDSPWEGYRHDSQEVIDLIETAINGSVNKNTWHTGGDWWNGAFHLKLNNPQHRDLIHHHYKKGDCENGYSGVVYLNKDPPASSGTKIWKNKKTGLITGNYGAFFEYHDPDKWDLYQQVENKYNRLVLFKGDVFHSGDKGFGINLNNCRLFQTFFFNTA